MFSLLLSLLTQCYYLILYINGSGSFPKPLGADEEQQCFARMKAGDAQARDRLIECNMRLVAHMVKKYYAAGQNQEDLISIGTIGLIKAIESFKPEKGTRFSTYAARCVENEILMYFRSIRKLQGELFLSDPIDDKEGNTLSLADILSSDESIDEQVELSLHTQRLYQLLTTTLTKREYRVLCERYGLYGTRPHTQREVAASMGISRSYISRLETKAIEKLHDAFFRREP